ncbi:MAG: hypothetical protein QOI20_782, partial [Acidimicrobiaceae bacterium]|jgi:flavin reductase (DIM6/NTAB) family NADH-FMN oxidoreductase RutF|nr:hypothetical protein [Acidimicrobiaceae bacterium]
MPLPQEAFDRLVGSIDYPMAIVTAAASADEMAGCLVGFTTQCSIKPPRWMVCLSKLNRTLHVAVQAPILVVHFPTVENRELAALFGHETGDEVDKFARCDWRPGPDGTTPVLTGVARWFAGQVLQHHDYGDHVGFLVQPVDAAFDTAFDPARDAGGQLGFQAVKDLAPGHPA